MSTVFLEANFGVLKQQQNKLHVSVNTINTHRQNLIKKLEVKSSHGLVKKALELGLTTHDV